MSLKQEVQAFLGKKPKATREDVQAAFPAANSNSLRRVLTEIFKQEKKTEETETEETETDEEETEEECGEEKKEALLLPRKPLQQLATASEIETFYRILFLVDPWGAENNENTEIDRVCRPLAVHVHRDHRALTTYQFYDGSEIVSAPTHWFVNTPVL